MNEILEKENQTRTVVAKSVFIIVLHRYVHLYVETFCLLWFCVFACFVLATSKIKVKDTLHGARK